LTEEKKTGAPDFWITGKYIDVIERLRTLETLETIKTIEKINPTATENVVIDRIDLIRQISKIIEISTLRDLIHRPPELIVNSNAEEDFVGWTPEGDVTIDDTVAMYGNKSWKFPANKHGAILQFFPIPIGVDWFEDFFFYVRASVANVNCIRVTYWYSDGTHTDQDFMVSLPHTWEKKTLTPEAGKKIQYIRIVHFVDYAMDTWIDAIFMVF